MAIAEDGLHRPGTGSRVSGCIQQVFGEADDGGQRSTNLMAHVGQKQAFGPVGGIGLQAGHFSRFTGFGEFMRPCLHQTFQMIPMAGQFLLVGFLPGNTAGKHRDAKSFATLPHDTETHLVGLAVPQGDEFGHEGFFLQCASIKLAPLPLYGWLGKLRRQHHALVNPDIPVVGHITAESRIETQQSELVCIH